MARQHATVVAGGRRFPDVRFDDIKLILEIDGREFHKTDEQVENDDERQVLLIDAGWTVLRLTVRQIRKDPAGTARRVRRIVDRMRSEIPKHEATEPFSTEHRGTTVDGSALDRKPAQH